MGLVRLYATLRPRAGAEGAVEVPWSPGATVADVMRELLRRRPGLDGYILDNQGNLLRSVIVFLDGRDIRYLKGLETCVEGGSELSIFPAVAGG